MSKPKPSIPVALTIHSLQAGGMERVMVELIRHFSVKPEMKVHVILYGLTREIFYTIPDNIILHRPSFEFNPNRRFISTLKTLLFLRRKLKELQPRAILSLGEYWNNFMLLAALGLPYPVFVSDRSQPDKPLGKFQDALRKWLYPTAEGVIAQTETARQIYLKMYTPKRITVIGNPIRAIGSNGSPLPRKNQILMVGRLIKSKHQDELIRIFASINDPAWHLVLVGDDHLKQQNRVKLEALIEELGMQGRVELAGKRLDVEQFYLQSKIFAFTSSSEGFPNVIGEAMSAGLPVVAYDCIAGPSEMIEDGDNGYLVPLHDTDTFKMRLTELMQNPEKAAKMGAAARRSIHRFSSSAIAEKFYDLMMNTIH